MAAMASPIVLTDSEKQLFDTLLAAAKAASLNTTLRCAGGWVRDKLLGKNSPDIDIALDDMYGKDFAEKVNEYLNSQGVETRTVAVIQVNPDQSKHLETARLKIHGMWIDLVNLRSESYASGSRIPTIEFGTPTQDALRRDFTINSLFYNLNTSSVEDLTGKGLEDLRDGLLRTPLPPMETFLDDPLRVLRAIRFAARFSFRMDDALVEAASTQQVRKALGEKVSRERIGTELDGMFTGPDPVAAVQYIQRFRLFPAVFTLPEPPASSIGDTYGARCIATMQAADKVGAGVQEPLTAEERRLCLLAGLLLPLRKAVIIVKKKEVPVSQSIVKDSIKWKAKDGEHVATLHAAAADFAAVHAQQQGVPGSEAAQEGANVPADAPADVRVALGLAVRKAGALWRVGIILSALLKLPEAAALGQEEPSEDGQSDTRSPTNLQQCHDQVALLLAAVSAYGLQGAHEWKSLIDGKQVMQLTGAKGARVGQITQEVLKWQLASPKGTREECEAWLKLQFPQS